MSVTESKDMYLNRFKGYLEKFDWKPESITQDEEGQYSIKLLANIDIKEIEIKIRFKEDGLWIYFSSLFLPKIEKNHIKVYENILHLNFKTTMTKFGISENKNIYALIELPMQEIDYSEFASALKRMVNDINKYIIPCVELLRMEGVDAPYS
jgi:hypothetical protein